jgi:hypothetical protein
MPEGAPPAILMHTQDLREEHVDLAELREWRGRNMRARSGDEWEARRVPVLAALAPVMTSVDGEITYPGDPMCLYGALSVTIRTAMIARERGCDTSGPYPDLCPDWGTLPTTDYRLTVADHGIRPAPDGSHCSDQSVFDPRVWTAETEAAFRSVLRDARPRIFLVSTVSPGHRYALEMARVVKAELPDCLVVMGGRHVDETVRYSPRSGVVDFAYSSTVRAIWDGRAAEVIDFQVSGDAYFSLDVLLRAIVLAMDLDTKVASTACVIPVLAAMLAEQPPRGDSAILALTPGAVHAFPVVGGRIDLAGLPSPYRAFAIRSRFPVFATAGHMPGRTAHLMVSNACPYHCDFCSESAALAGGLNLLRTDPAATVCRRICEYVSYGAQSVFFDDSVFWSGNFGMIREFCAMLRRVRSGADAEIRREWIDHDSLEPLRSVQWGAQLTVDLLTVLHSDDAVTALLHDMRLAGCTYIYLGIESMSDQVMNQVHKNLRRLPGRPWKDKVRITLERIRDAGIRAGSSLLFGLEGETRCSIDETIEEVGLLIDDGLLMLASPNILTYHPATPLTRTHAMADHLDYHSLDLGSKPPYSYFEEAFPGVVSCLLSEQDVWHIHRSAARRWGGIRNTTAPTIPKRG